MDFLNILIGLLLFVLFILILFSYYLIYAFYKKIESQRIEITKLVREISYLKKK